MNSSQSRRRSLGALGATLFLVFSLPSRSGAVPQIDVGALIQTRGTPLRSGLIRGGGFLPLERAENGDTPVLPFASDQGPVRLLLDTGAASTMVTDTLVRRLGLSSHRLSPREFSMAGGGVDCQTRPLASVRLPDLRLSPQGEAAPLQLQGVEALVISGGSLPSSVDGVVGAPLLRQMAVVVDPVEQKVLLGPPAHQWRRARGREPLVLPLRWSHGVPVGGMHGRTKTGARIDSLSALFDTGAEGLFLTESLAAQLIPLRSSQPVRLVGVCGDQAARRQLLSGIALASAEDAPRSGVEAIILQNPVFALLGVEAIVGQELLRSRRQLWRLDLPTPRLELW